MQTWTIIVVDDRKPVDPGYAYPVKTEELPVRWTERGMVAMRDGARYWVGYSWPGLARRERVVGVPTIFLREEAVLWR